MVKYHILDVIFPNSIVESDWSGKPLKGLDVTVNCGQRISFYLAENITEANLNQVPPEEICLECLDMRLMIPSAKTYIVEVKEVEISAGKGRLGHKQQGRLI